MLSRKSVRLLVAAFAFTVIAVNGDVGEMPEHRANADLGPVRDLLGGGHEIPFLDQCHHRVDDQLAAAFTTQGTPVDFFVHRDIPRVCAEYKLLTLYVPIVFLGPTKNTESRP